MRTFAAQRIEQAVALEESFNPVADAPSDVFPHSLGAFSGTPEAGGDRIQRRRSALHARAPVARLTADRRPAGRTRIRLALNVVIDWELQAWVMGFGAAATVIAPQAFADRIVESLDEARASYLRT